ncbi:SPFH domain-containing protein [bacterium]|nr:SPFH domain-containing protein [bacterium]
MKNEEEMKAVDTFELNSKSNGKIDLPSRILKIRIENDNDSMFFRVYGDVASADAKIVISDPNVAILIKDGVRSPILSNGAYPLYEEKEKHKKCLFGSKKYLKEKKTIDLIVYNPTYAYHAYWGLSEPIRTRDTETHLPVSFRSIGYYDIKISNVEKFHSSLVGSNRSFNMDNLLDRITPIVSQVVRNEIVNVINGLHLNYIDVTNHALEIAEKIQPLVSETLNEQYGLFVPIFIIDKLNIPDEERNAIEQVLHEEREKYNFKKDTKEIADEIERLDDKEWEREKYLINLRREDYEKYLEVIKVLGYPKHQKEEPKTTKSSSYCPKCGNEVEKDSVYCPKCGEQLKAIEKKCPHCGKVLTSKGKFCPSCGKEI